MTLQTTNSYKGLPSGTTISWMVTQVTLNPIQQTGSFQYTPYASEALGQANQTANALGSSVAFPITATQFGTYFTDAAITTATGLLKQCDAMANAVLQTQPLTTDPKFPMYGATVVS